MELLNPRMTITNADGVHWLVTFEHDFNDAERISLTVKVSKSSAPLSDIQREAFDRAIELLRAVSSKIAPDT